MKRIYKNMTIRQRLTISNLLMLIIPVMIAAVIFLVCMSLIWLWALRNTNSRFMDSADFYSACQEYNYEVEEALLTEDWADLYDSLDSIGVRLSWENICLLVSDGGQVVYSNGLEVSSDQGLKAAMLDAGGNGYISVDDRALYASVVSRESIDYQIFLSGQLIPPTFSKLRVLTGCAVVLLIISVIIATYLTNRFLIRFAFEKIQEPMEVLARGVQEISEGNLDYQIEYTVQDEFTPICENFNGMARRLKESVELIQKQEESRKELLAGISHDLRSPLTNISAYANGLIDGIAQTKEAQLHYLYMIRDKASEMIRMVSRLIQFSKMDNGDYPDYPERLELGQQIKELVQAMAPEYQEKGLEIAITETTTGCVYADPDQMNGILANIVDNSWKYKDKEPGHLNLSLAREQGMLSLRLWDDGPGVPEEALPKLFDAFYRSDPARKNPGRGSGLGLAIAANAVKRMKGQIYARNVSPTGLEIVIYLPEMKEGQP